MEITFAQLKKRWPKGTEVVLLRNIRGKGLGRRKVNRHEKDGIEFKVLELGEGYGSFSRLHVGDSAVITLEDNGHISLFVDGQAVTEYGPAQ
jgi:hypothetical protein